MRRVVITGLGVVSCLGNNQEEVHQSLLNSKSGISFAEEYKEHNLKKSFFLNLYYNHSKLLTFSLELL